MTAARAWFLFAPLLLCCSALRAGEKVDAQGDPLPEGAVARLGSARGWQPWGEYVSLAFSPAGKIIACANRNGTVRLWDAATLKPVGRLDVGDDTCTVHWLPCGKKIVVLRDQGRVACLPIDGGRTEWEITRAWCVSVGVSPDGKWLAAGGEEGKVELFDLKTGKSAMIFQRGDQRVVEVAFSHDGSRLACRQASSATWALRVWDVKGGKCLLDTLAPYERLGLALAFTADGKHLLTAGSFHDKNWQTRLVRWKLGATEPTREHELSGLTKLLDLRARWLLVAGENGAVVHSADCDDKPIPLDRGWEHVCTWAASPDGETIAGTSRDHLLLWSRRTGKRLVGPPGHVTAVDWLALSKDGSTVLSGARYSSDIHVWDARKGRVRHTINMPGTLRCLLLTPDGTRVVASTDQGLHTVDLKSRKVSAFSNGSSSRLSFVPGSECVLNTHSESVPCRIGDQVSLTTVSTLRTWDLKGQEGLEWPLENRAEEIHPRIVLLSPDGRWIASWSSDGPLHIWDARSGRRTLRFGEEKEYNREARFSPDGRVLAVVTGDEVHLFETATGLRRQRGKGDSDACCAAWLPGGRGLVLGHEDGALTVRDALSGRVAASLDAHGCRVSALAFSGDGKTLASGADDGTILLWKTPTPAFVTDRVGGLSAKQLANAWADLNSDDGERVSRAIAALADDPSRAVPFLEKQLSRGTPMSMADVKQLFADLDDRRFATRQKASAQLASLGKGIEPALADVRRTAASPEVRTRVDGILEELERKPDDAESNRRGRAVEVLERAGTPEARKLLKALAEQPEWTPLSREYRAALSRQP